MAFDSVLKTGDPELDEQSTPAAIHDYRADEVGASDPTSPSSDQLTNDIALLGAAYDRLVGSDATRSRLADEVDEGVEKNDFVQSVLNRFANPTLIAAGEPIATVREMMSPEKFTETVKHLSKVVDALNKSIGLNQFVVANRYLDGVATTVVVDKKYEMVWDPSGSDAHWRLDPTPRDLTKVAFGSDQLGHPRTLQDYEHSSKDGGDDGGEYGNFPSGQPRSLHNAQQESRDGTIGRCGARRIPGLIGKLSGIYMLAHADTVKAIDC